MRQVEGELISWALGAYMRQVGESVPWGTRGLHEAEIYLRFNAYMRQVRERVPWGTRGLHETGRGEGTLGNQGPI